MTAVRGWSWLGRLQWRTVRLLLPALACLLLLVATLLPWQVDPLGQVSTAWDIVVDIGWQVHYSFFSYGALCCLCALVIGGLAYGRWPAQSMPVQRPVAARITIILCIFPTIMFIMQYMCIDVVGIDRLAQHEVQALLIAQHFGYTIAAQRIVVRPFVVDDSTLWGHAQLFINQAAVGCILPCGAACMLLGSMSRRRISAGGGQSMIVRRLLPPLLCMLVLVLYARPVIAVVCEYEAKGMLTTGNYRAALQWLERAVRFNPAFEGLASYHIERGQALYFLKVDQQGSDSQGYLAWSYRNQRGYLDAYQQLLVLWQTQRQQPWVVNQMSQTLERLAEGARPLGGVRSTRMQRNDAALVWVQLLKQVDPGNVYARYLLARLQYERNNFVAASEEMTQVIGMSCKSEIQSSAYTYRALSAGGLGKYEEERILLFQAIELDTGYRNNIARESLSGLR